MAKSKITKKRTILRILLRVLGWLLVVILVVFSVAFYKFDQYLKSNEEKILAKVDFLNRGTVSFKEVDVHWFRDFPNISVTVNDVKLVDSSYTIHQKPILTLAELQVNLALSPWRKKEFEIQSVLLKNGQLIIHKDKNGYSNLKSIIRPPKTTQDSIQKPPPFTIKSNPLKVQLKNVDFQIIDKIKTSNIRGTAADLTAKLTIENEEIKALIDMDLAIDTLSFKENKGVFLRNSRLSGQFKAELDSNKVTFQPFDLKLNEHHFNLYGVISTSEKVPTQLVLENEQTNFNAIVPLLTLPLQEKIEPYKIDGLFYTKTTITEYKGTPAIVNVDFEIPKNTIKIQQHTFKNSIIKGRFVNRLYDDERLFQEGKKNIRIELEEIKTDYDWCTIEAKNMLFTDSPTNRNWIKAAATVTGKASGISQWLESEEYIFEEGKFTVEGKVDASLDDFEALIKTCSVELAIRDVAVLYQPADVVFPFEELVLRKKVDDARFSIISSTFAENNRYQLAGSMTNIVNLLLDVEGTRTTSVVELTANKLNWRDFVDLFGKSGYLTVNKPKSNQDKKKSMKETISGIEHNFNPSLSIAIDTSGYYDLIEFYNLKTGIHFEDGKTIILEKTHLDIEGGHVEFEAAIDLSQPYHTSFECNLKAQNINIATLLPKLRYFNIELLENLEAYPDNMNITIALKGVLNDETGLVPSLSTGIIHFDSEALEGNIVFAPAQQSNEKDAMTTSIQLKGNPNLFNNFFKTESFLFNEKGEFDVVFDYTGALTSVKDLLDNAKIFMTLSNGSVYYPKADATFPLTKVKMNVHDNLGNFNILLQSDSLKQILGVSGSIDNLSELIIGNTGKYFTTEVNIYSPKLHWATANELINPRNPKPKKVAFKPTKKLEKSKLKETITGLLNKFNPTVTAEVGRFVFSEKLAITDFKTEINLLDSNLVALEKTGFKFEEGSVELNAIFDLEKEETPVNATLQTKRLDVARLLESLDYLNIEALQNTETLNGNISLDLNLKTVISADGKQLLQEKTAGVIDFELYQVQVEGLKIIDDIAAKVQKNKLGKVKFAPLNNRITINGNRIDVPQMEIQTNVLELFVEGVVKTDLGTNIWLSIPYNNLAKKDKTIVPKKRGYAATKSKIFIEITTDSNGDYKMKFHLTKKKFYKQRGMRKQYKLNKKKNRAVRKNRKASE